MDSAIVRQLFKALAQARTKPASFRIDARGAEGIGEMTVLVMDSWQFVCNVEPHIGPTEMK